jgi:hypothetical protein
MSLEPDFSQGEYPVEDENESPVENEDDFE